VSLCHICDENDAADARAEAWSVARLQTGYVRLNPNQSFLGATFFVSKECVRELHDLDRRSRLLHLEEMSEVAAAVFEVFQPSKLNYEALGNSTPHLHWWLTPRYTTDPRPGGPVWEDLDFLRAQWTAGARLDDDERDDRRLRLLHGLRRRDLVIEEAFA
jgi:diadenosine tetraphosphate (Ap4A) HIT family hydrolase